MKFALVTADRAHNKKFYMNGENSDVTSFMNWVKILDGVHLSFIDLRQEDGEGVPMLSNFDVVMFSGHLNHLVDIVKLATALKDTNTITMFYPEGSAQLYDNSINGFQPLYYDAWRACDVFSVAEEDKEYYYKSFVGKDTAVKFVHVPVTREMEDGMFLVPRYSKVRDVVVYGDNNPNHPMIAMMCAYKLGLNVTGIDLKKKDFNKIFPGLKLREASKLGQYPFLRLLGQSIIHFYPTEWIGTSREAISCASVGTPCIGSRDSHTQNRLFPGLGFNIYDIQGMIEKAIEVVNNQKLYQETVEFARANIHFYGLEQTLKRFYSAVEAGRKLKEKRSATVLV